MGQPLSYVFWHRPRSGTPPERYERRLERFQSSLRSHGPDGLIDALSFRLESRPWSKRMSMGYEDWYLVKDFRALGALNAVAVANPNKTPHDDIARGSTGGAGGVYKMLKGDLPLRDAGSATWIRKPARTPYQAFLNDLSKLVADRRTDLWQRQMVLGPAAEFCMHGEGPLDLPSALLATTMRVQVVGSKSAEGLGSGKSRARR
jgi:hypothetical protein